MKRKYEKRTNTTILLPVAFGVFAGLIIQLLCCFVLAYLLEKGSVGETAANGAAIAVQGLGIAIATATSWLMNNACKMRTAALTGGIVFTVPAILSLLLWGIDFMTVLVRAAVSVAIFGAVVWLLHCVESRGAWRKLNRRYC